MGWMDDVGGYKSPATDASTPVESNQGFMSDVSDKGAPAAPIAKETKAQTTPADYVNMPYFYDDTTKGSPSTKDTTVFGRAGENLLPNTQKVWADTLHGLTHPLETAEGILQIGQGAFSTGMEALGAKPGFGVQTPSPKEMQKIEQEKEAFRSFYEPYKQWFTEPGAFKRDVAETPAETAMAASLPLTGAEKVLSTAGLAGPARFAETASKVNPIGLPMEAASGALKYGVAPLAGKVSSVFGVKGEGIPAAYQAGREGSLPFVSAYLNPMQSGDEAVYNLAKKAMAKQYEERQDAWNAGQKDLLAKSEKGQRADYTQMLEPINQEVQAKYDPRMGANNFSPEQMKLLDEMANHIHERSQRDPAKFALAHTASDLDNFKRLFTDAFEDRAKSARLSHVYNDIRGNIVDQIKKVSPKYADDMALYGAQTDEINQILKQFKLGSRASKDDAIERLMSKNANKRSLLDTLAEHEPELPNVIAGRQLKLFQLPTLDRITYALGVNPFSTAGLPLAIPGVVGAGAYGTGLGMTAAQRYGLPAFYQAHQQQEQSRQGRASGGKVDHNSAEAISDQLVAAFANAKKNEDLESKVLLNKPDDVIIDALKEAKRAI